MTNGSPLITLPQIVNLSQTHVEAQDYYFAYGSNMNLGQISARCSRPKAVCTARLTGYRLAFYGHTGIWDGAIETVEPAPECEVWGVVFALTRMDWERLDSWQDARMDGGGMYFHTPVTVEDATGQRHDVRIYRKDVQGIQQAPSQQYLEHIAQGARENGVPLNYINALLKRSSSVASYSVPLRSRSDLSEFAGISCEACESGAA